MKGEKSTNYKRENMKKRQNKVLHILNLSVVQRQQRSSCYYFSDVEVDMSDELKSDEEVSAENDDQSTDANLDK